MSGPEILGEPLPFEEKIELPNWHKKQESPDAYADLHAASLADLAGHWDSVAKELDWYRPWDETVSKGDHPHVYKWFKGVS